MRIWTFDGDSQPALDELPAECRDPEQDLSAGTASTASEIPESIGGPMTFCPKCNRRLNHGACTFCGYDETAGDCPELITL